MIEDLKNKYPGYTLSIEDSDFLHREELRGARLMFEYEKPELALRDQKIKSTIVVFDSARVMAPEQAEQFAAGTISIGLNITLTFEEEPNPYSSPELTFHFNYFSMRKLHLVNRCAGIAIMPGGWETMDELFDKAGMALA